MNSQTLIKCPVCSWEFQENQFDVLPYQSNAPEENSPRQICFCRNCEVGIAFPHLTDDQMVKYYSQGEYWKKNKSKVLLPKDNPGHYASAKARWEFVKPYIKDLSSTEGLSILDIGAGYGYFGTVAAQDQSVNIQKYSVVEIDPVFRDSLQKTWQRRYPAVEFQSQESIRNIKGKFNLIVFSHILEHLNDPQAMIKAASEKLRAGGLIFIDVPYRDYLFKNDVFPHILFFSREGMRRMIESAGFDVKALIVAGWNREESPLNYRRDKRSSKYIEKVFYKFRRIIPSCFSGLFFERYLGANRLDSNGTWLRVIAQKPTGNAS